MTASGDVTFVFRTHNTARYSMAAIIGALETDPRLQDLEIVAPHRFSLGLVRQIAARRRLIIGYSIMSTSRQELLKEAQYIRKEFGDSIVLVGGGAHATARPSELLSHGFDYVVVGEGEQAVRDLVDAVINEREPAGIPGVVTQQDESYPSPKDLPTVRLDDFPPFAIKTNVGGPIEVTRGCPFRCKFCATPFITGGRVRHRSIDSIVHWLSLAVDKWGFKRTWFLSPNALSYGGHGRRPSPEKMERLLRRVTSVPLFEELYFGSFPSEVRPDFVTRQLLDMMRQYVANKTVQIGVQSGSDRVLQLAGRNHTVAQGVDAVRIALDCGFVPHVDMIFGLPGESQADVSASLELCYDLVEMGAMIHAHVFMPLPGSAFENMPPGHLDRRCREVLGDLARRGVLTGSWGVQEDLARRVASPQ